MLALFIGFGALIAVGCSVSVALYARLGYPSLRWVHTIRLSDEIDTVFAKVTTALGEGFDVNEHDSETLVIEKTFSEPPCVLRFEARRRRRGRWQKLSVRCLNHRWLDRSISSGRNW